MQALSRDIPITEYEPKKIKMAITGNEILKNKWLRCCSNFRLKELPKTSIVLMD
jgi:crossover junction endodeoxyribonuclease RuvC